MYYSTTSVSVDELTGRGLISVRAMNICKRSRLFNFETLYAHYLAHGTFLTLPQMGQKTNQSLVQLCSKAEEIQAENATDTIYMDEVPKVAKQPDAVVAAYQQIPEANRAAAEQVYGNKICGLNRRTMRALLVLYKNKSLAGLINGLIIKPSAFISLADLLLTKGADLYAFLTELTEAIFGDKLAETVRACKLRCLMHQIKQLTHKSDERMEAFFKTHIDDLPSGNFPVSNFIDLLITCDNTLRPGYKNAIQSSNLFYHDGLPPSRELGLRLGISSLKLKRMYDNNGQHHPVYILVTQGIKILQSQGLTTPSRLTLSDAAFHFYPHGIKDTGMPFTNRMLVPLLSSLNPAYRLFYQANGDNICMLFVNKKIETWFNTGSFFSLLEKKNFLKANPNNALFLLQLLLPFCKHTPAEAEQEALFSFTKPLLLHLYQQQLQNCKIKPEKEIVAASRRELIYRFIKEQDRHCHADEIREYLAKNSDDIPRKRLLKYLDKCSALFKPLNGHLFQLREWDAYNKWQKETVLRLVINFLAAYKQPKHIYTISSYVMKYKNVTPDEVAQVVINSLHTHFAAFGHGCFGLQGSGVELPETPDKKIPAPWLETASSLFTDTAQDGVTKEDIVKFIARRYRITKAKAEVITNTRTRLGEWKETNTKRLLPALEQPAQTA